MLREFDVLRQAVHGVLRRLFTAPAHRELTGRLEAAPRSIVVIERGA